MNPETSLSSRIESVVGSNVSAFSRKSGVGESLLRQYIAGSKPGLDKAAAIAKAGNVSLEWLATGFEEQHGVNDIKGVYASIPRHTRLEDGEEVDVESDIASLSLSSKWLKQKGLAPVDMVYTRMPDDSMKPTIPEGGLVVIDGRGKLIGDGVYALMYGGTLTVKRLQTGFGGCLFIRNDNSKYGDQQIKPDDIPGLSIIGKVVWVGGEI